MGINLKRAGRLEEALAYYKSAMDLEPENPIIYYNTGILYNVMSDYDNAVQALE